MNLSLQLEISCIINDVLKCISLSAVMVKSFHVYLHPYPFLHSVICF
jgi:hypothetical protein